MTNINIQLYSTRILSCQIFAVNLFLFLIAFKPEHVVQCFSNTFLFSAPAVRHTRHHHHIPLNSLYNQRRSPEKHQQKISSSTISTNFAHNDDTINSSFDEDQNKTNLPPLYIDETSSSSSTTKVYANQRKELQMSSTKNTQTLKIQASFDRISQRLYGSNNTTTTTTNESNVNLMKVNKRIVRYGQLFQLQQTQTQIHDNDDDNVQINSNKLSSQMERVPGCIATVYVQTTLIPIISSKTSKNSLSKNNSNNLFMGLKEENHKSQKYRVRLTGTADALLSQGLLAILSLALSGDNDDDNKNHDGLTAHDVLSLSPDSISDHLKLRKLLSPGRNDGLASMLHVVQSQIKSLLQQEQQGQNAQHTQHAQHAQHAQYDDRNSEATQSKYTEDTEDREDTVVDNLNVVHPTRNHNPTVAMLLSGGVDSSVALNLLTRKNYTVTAFYLKIWLEDELAHLGQCPWEDDYKTCQAVCMHANVPLETISLQKEYKDSVIQYTVAEAKKGRTPNPDIMCNSRVKFGCFYDAIEGRGFDYVATGHYAQLVEDEQEIEQEIEQEDEQEYYNNNHHVSKKKMKRAPDPVKDQSYFLSMLTQKQLSNVLFPIGKYTKKEVRALAEEFDLPNKNRPESQGLCFLGKVKFEEFLGAYLGENPGDILDASSTDVVLGKHKGLWFHTIGQRKGIGKLLNPKATAHGPWYIVAKDIKRNALLASNQYDQEVFTRARSEFYVEDIKWISGFPPKRLIQYYQSSSSSSSSSPKPRFNMKIRHGPKIVQGTLQLVKRDDQSDDQNDVAKESNGKIILDQKDGGLAPGQFVVFYGLGDEGDEDEMECLGAGVISEKHWAKFLMDTNDATENLSII